MDCVSFIPKTIATPLAKIFKLLLAIVVFTTIQLPQHFFNRLHHVAQPSQNPKVLIKIIFAVGLAFAFGMNSIFYVLLFLPVTTIERIWTSFMAVSDHLEGQHVAAKIPIFIGLAFSMAVLVLFYVLFFYLVVGLEKTWTTLFGGCIDSKTSPKPQYLERETTLHGEFECGRNIPIDEIHFLDLGPGIEKIKKPLQGKAFGEILAEVSECDDGRGARAGGLMEQVGNRT